MRKLASIKKVDKISPIANADSIEVAVFGGWKVVIKKDEFNVGDLVVYLEIDSFVPHTLAPFLTKGKEPKIFGGIEGNRLKTVKLRGQLSQGLVLPMSVLPVGEYKEGDDVTEILNIRKWEEPMRGMSSEITKSQFPSFLLKTEQERIQNLGNEYKEYMLNDEWIWTEKLDGKSFTAYYLEGEFGVCSRSLELRIDKPSLYTQVANIYNLKEKLEKLNQNIAIQGEIVGCQVRKNRYKFSTYQLYLFDVFDIDKGCYVSYDVFMNIAKQLDISTVPILGIQKLPKDIDSLLNLANGYSVLNNSTIREGLVIKNMDRTVSFKVISNDFLLKQK